MNVLTGIYSQTNPTFKNIPLYSMAYRAQCSPSCVLGQQWRGLPSSGISSTVLTLLCVGSTVEESSQPWHIEHSASLAMCWINSRGVSPAVIIAPYILGQTNLPLKSTTRFGSVIWGASVAYNATECWWCCTALGVSAIWGTRVA